MCQSKSQGGRRCAAHTRPAYLRVISALYEGNEADAASKAGLGFEAIRDFAMTGSGRPHILNDINALEEHYFAYPSTSIEQETARQTTLATLHAAVAIGDQRHEALAEVKAIVDETGREMNRYDAANQVEKVVAERHAQQAAAHAEMQARTHGWALGADTIPLEATLPERTNNPAIYEALTYRLANAVPGETFNVRAGGDTLAVAYDEQFETDTGRTTYTLKLDTPTSHSEHQFISRDHITVNVREALFTKGAWADRRTAANPNLATVIEGDYNRGLAQAARPYITDYDRQGVATYLNLVAEDEATLEAAREEHRAAQAEWNAEQQKRQGLSLRRLLPTSPPPQMRQVERKTAPHPFGGMTKDEWVAYETENLRDYGTTDLSEFSTHRGRAPVATGPSWVSPTHTILTPQPERQRVPVN